MKQTKIKASEQDCEFSFNHYITTQTKKKSLNDLKKRHIQKNKNDVLSRKIAISLLTPMNRSLTNKLEIERLYKKTS